MMQNKQALDARLVQLRAFLNQDPQNGSLRAEIFDAALAAGNFTEAGVQVAHALLADQADSTWLNREAQLLLAQGYYSQAEAVLTRLVDGGQDDAGTRYNIAYAQFGQGNYSKAREILLQLREDSSEVGASAWALWLRCEHHLLHLEEGLEAFREALSHRLMPAEAWGVASLMAIDAAHPLDAKTWSEHALRVDPDQMEALVARGSLALGRQEVQEAMHLFEQAIRINAKDGRTWSGLAFTHLLNLDFPRAKDAFRKAIEAMPDHIGTWIGLGWCEFLALRLQAARVAFEQALTLDRNFGESHGAMAVVLARLGENEQARMEIDIALKLDPKGLSARFAQSLLTGETNDPQAFLKMTHRVLAQHPDPFASEGEYGRTLADVILKFKR